VRSISPIGSGRPGSVAAPRWITWSVTSSWIAPTHARSAPASTSGASSSCRASRTGRGSWASSSGSRAATSSARSPTPTCGPGSPPDYAIGCERILPSNRWYPAVTQPNVDVVTAGIASVRPDGIVDGGGELHQVDTIAFATDFRVTDIRMATLTTGTGGRRLSDASGTSTATAATAPSGPTSPSASGRAHALRPERVRARHGRAPQNARGRRRRRVARG
jgi:hypothetical protein